jgi:tRNA (pseudouridine54-N1)-methyltransferase
MREFILRARKAPTSGAFSLDSLPKAGHMEVVASCISNAIFVSNQLRTDTTISVVLEGGPEPPKTLRISGDNLGSLDGFDERSIARTIQTSLEAGRGLELHETRAVDRGITIAKIAFEHLLQDRPPESLFYLDRRGQDIRHVDLPPDPTFVFSDYLSMPKKSGKYLARLGATPISLGPKTLFASHCIVLVHNEMDRRANPCSA